MTWKVIDSNVTGNSHVREGKPCQDYVGFWNFPDEHLVIGAVADGSGSAKYSDKGAKITVKCTTQYIQQKVENSKVKFAIKNQVTANNFFVDLLKIVKKELDKEANKNKHSVKELACTLLVFIATPDWLAAMQVGDGLIVIRQNNCDKYQLLFKPDKGEFVNSTTFVTSSNVKTQMKVIFDESQINFICAATDWCENIAVTQLENWQPLTNFFKPLEDCVLTNEKEIGKSEIDSLLNSNLVNEETDDDKTLLLCVWDDSQLIVEPKIELIKQISHGGQGDIWETSQNGFVAKIYYSVDSMLIEKLQVMVDNPPEDPMRKKGHVSIAWPEDLLQDSKGRFVGFIMPEIGNGQTLINVYNPSQRENMAPGFNWLYLHITALNVAIIVEAVHAKNYIIGDIKAENLLVNPKALVSIVDTDSFQIRHPQTQEIYPCTVGSEEYTPPELIGKDFKRVNRLEIHDRFGLGVIIYHLLFGYHPYEGVDKSGGKPTNLNERISKTSWPHAPKSPISPSIISIPLDIVHPKIKTCFHRCFTVGSEEPHLRPSAKEWRDALEVAIADLTDCPNEAGHQYAKTYGKCYWCERKLQMGGYDIFPTVPDSSKYTVAAFRASQKVKAPPKYPIKKHSSPIAQWITVTAVTLASLVGIPPLRENITLPVIKHLIQTIKK